MQKAPDIAGNDRDRSIKGVIACLVLVLALFAVWFGLRAFGRSQPPREPAVVVRLKVPQPLPAGAMPQEHAAEDARLGKDAQSLGEAGNHEMIAVSDPPIPGATTDGAVEITAVVEKSDNRPTIPIDPLAGAVIPAPAPAFSIQAAAFLSPDNAIREQKAWFEKGHAAVIHEYQDARQRKWYAVRIGRFDNRDEADQALDHFNRVEGAAAFVVRFP